MNASNEDGATMESEEMIARSSSWTLACDSMLLNKLQKFSKDLESQSTEVKEECQKLFTDTTVLQAKLNNVTSQFTMLSNHQFVENRVQDFEETDSRSTHITSKNKTKAEKESELIAKMKKAINIGISISEQHGQTLNQETPSSKLALPFIIGSSKYFSNRYVGLVEEIRYPIDAELSTDTNLERKMADNIEPLSSNHSKYYVQSAESNSIMPSSSHIPNTTSVPDDPIIIPPSPKLKGVSDSLSSNSYSYPQVPQPRENPPSVIPQPRSNQIPKSNSLATKTQERFFDDGPPDFADSDESDDDFRPIMHGGVGRLFPDEDDDDDEDIFTDKSLLPSTKTQNLFSNVPDLHARRESPPPIIKKTNHNDIHNKAKGQSKIGQEPIKNDKVSSNVGVPQNLSNQSGHKPKIPTGGVSVFGKVPPLGIPKLRNQHITEHKSVVGEPEAQVRGSIPNSLVTVSGRGSSVGTNEDTNSQSSLTSRGLTSSQGSLSEPVIVPTSIPKPKPRGIFNHDSDEDLFSSKIQPTSKKSSTILKDNIHRPVNSLTKSQSTKAKIRNSIFEDSDSDEDLFLSGSSTSSKTNQSRQSKSLVFPTSEKSVVRQKGKTKGGLFGDSDSSDTDTDLLPNTGNVNKLIPTKDNIIIKSNLNEKTVLGDKTISETKVKSSSAFVKNSNLEKMSEKEPDVSSSIQREGVTDQELSNTSGILNIEEEPITTRDLSEIVSEAAKEEDMEVRGGVSVSNVLPIEIPKLEDQHITENKSVVGEPEAQVRGSTPNSLVTVSGRGSSVGTNEDTNSQSSLTSRGLTSSQGSLSEPVIVPTSSPKPKPRGIFNHDSDEDLFSSKIQPTSKKSSTILKDNIHRPVNSLTKSQSTKAKIRNSIFEDSDSDEDLFLSGSSTSSKTNQSRQSKSLVFPTSEKSVVRQKGKTKGGLFGDSDSFDTDTDLLPNAGNVNKLIPTKDNIIIKSNLNEKTVLGDKTISETKVKSSSAFVKNSNLEKMSGKEPDVSSSIQQEGVTDQELSNTSEILNIEEEPVELFEETPPDSLPREKITSNLLLSSLAKGRARIQTKRKPPSKKFLHSYKNSEDEGNLSTF